MMGKASDPAAADAARPPRCTASVLGTTLSPWTETLADLHDVTRPRRPSRDLAPLGAR
jgi:hypothetical protein